MANFDKEIVGIQNIAEMKSKLLLIARGLDRDGTFLKSEYSDLDVLEDPETKIIASFLPDEIIYNVDDYSHRSFDCAILAGDVSGFTDLTEKYSKMDGGASKVTEVLNSYIGNMVQEIMSHGGDILNFSGDAFIAIYKKSENFTKRDAVREAIDCGLIIQKRYGNYPTDIGINIKVKLLISAGILHFSILGDKKNAQYLSIGQPIWDLKEGDGKCGPGDVVVCQSAWRIINSNDYNYTEFDDNMYIQVHGIGQNWRMVQRSRYSVFTKEESFEKFSVRPAVNHAAINNRKDKLRKFIIRPILNALDSDHPLDYLTEVRQITVLFMNIVISKKISPYLYMNTANNVYKIVSGYLKEYEGDMNKINVFDKDLLILTIFGFRGYLVGSEADRALLCACKCFKGISPIAYIESVSLGICSGNTYCGVFGHALRKEYTVIGKIVNKAARIMMAYNNSISCERGTFLLSKLKPAYFTLREYKPLKGIASPGPIYAFKIVKTRDEEYINLKDPSHPILGREKETALYLHLLDVAKQEFRSENVITNVLITQGPPLIGQKRLTQEFIYVTPKDIPINKIRLSNLNVDLYEPIRKIFLPAMGLTDVSSKHKIEEEIRTRLNSSENEKKLWILNPVFNVNFMRYHMELKFTERVQALREILMKLAYSTFATLWVVMIRKINYIREDIWKLINELSKKNLIFITCEKTVNETKNLQYTYEENVQVLTLPPLDKVLLCFFICQYLNVRGISVELKRYIQKKCVGNPGYMEKFLSSMIHSGEINITSLTLKNAYSIGMVLPPSYIFDRNIKSKDIEWNMYDECYKEDDADDIYDDTVIQVGKMNLENVILMDDKDILSEEQLSLNDTMMKIYDSFTPYEQVIVKASSVLHLQFQRQKLMYLINTKPDRTTALAIKSLFEKRVLTCAHGDFVDEENSMNFKGRLKSPGQNDIKCDCRGIVLDESSLDLPKYSICGYMQFVMTNFKDMCYNLLTDKQSKDFHHRAIRYLQHETKKCKSCGKGYFAIGLSKNVRFGSSRWKKIGKYDQAFINPGSVGDSKNTNVDEIEMMYRKSLYSLPESVSNSSRRKTTSYFSTGDVSSHMAKSELSESQSGFVLFQRRPIHVNILRTNSFSDFDFTDCKCLSILMSMYCEMLRHCKGIENVEKIFEVSIDYSYVCMESKNDVEAENSLKLALELLESPIFSEKYQNWMIDLKRAKVYTILGQGKMNIKRDLQGAYKCFIKALVLYGFPFPRNLLKIKRQIKYESCKHWCRIYINSKIGTVNTDEESEFCNNISECLQNLSKLFVKRQMYHHAELAAIWALNKALDGGENFLNLCNAYAQMLTINNCVRRRNYTNYHERSAIKLTRLRRNFDKQELEAIAWLMLSVFVGRFVASKLNLNLLELGRVIWQIGKTTHSFKILLQILPLMILFAIIFKLMPETVDILNDFFIYSNDDVDGSGLFDYYCACLILQLETGFSIESFKSCESFLLRSTFNFSLKDPSSRKRLAVILWLWNLRKKYWNSAKNWENEAFDFEIIENEPIFNNLLSGSYLLEGLILLLVHKMDKRNLTQVRKLCKKVDDLIKQLKRQRKRAKIMYVRVEHLILYYKLVLSNNYKILDKVKKLRTFAEENLISCEADRIHHNELAWMNKLKPLIESEWSDSCEINKILHPSEADPKKIIYFTLPLPTYL